MLKVENLEVAYGMIKAIKGVSFEVNEGEVIALIGANGAGKTTILHTVTGLLSPQAGSIVFEGVELTKIPAHKIVGMGMAHVPEGRRVFQELTVLENLKLGAFILNDKKRIESNLEYVYTHFPRLKERRGQVAGTLSGGEQQMLAVSRALMSRPKLLMMDEPSLGLAPLIIKDIFAIIQRVNQEEHLPVLLIEQNANFALAVADYAYVLETGTIQLEGTGKELLSNEKVKELYLGTGD